MGKSGIWLIPAQFSNNGQSLITVLSFAAALWKLGNVQQHRKWTGEGLSVRYSIFILAPVTAWPKSKISIQKSKMRWFRPNLSPDEFTSGLVN